jgi:hypothetical protein
MPNWDALLNAAVPAAAGVISGIGANQAQGKGIQLSQDALNQAKAEASASYGQGGSDAANALGTANQNSQNALNYGFQGAGNALASGFNQANQFLPWGYQQGRADRATGLSNSLGALSTGYGNAYNTLNPYAQSGVQALNQANNLIFGKGTPGGGGMPVNNPMPQGQTAPQIPMPSMPQFSAPGGMPQGMIKQNSLATGTGGATGSALGNQNVAAGLNSIPDQTGNALANQAFQQNGLRSAAGGLAGGIAAGALMAAIPALAAVPFFGPIMAGVGLLVAKLWNNHNPDKTWASNAINDVGLAVWGPQRDGNGGILGEVKSGKLTADQGIAAYQALYQGWINAMHTAGVDQSIIDRSVQSQGQYWATTPDIIRQAAGQAPQQGGTPPAGPTGGNAPASGPTRGAGGYAMGGQVPGQDQGTDTVPAMLRGGEFVMAPEAVRHFGVAKLQQMNEAGKQNALSNPQHFATGGSVAPYDPTNPNKTQDWTQQLDPTGQLPAGYSSYTQGYDPVKQQWQYNPNTGAAYTGGDTRGVATPYSGPAAGTTQPMAAGAPAAGDPNYYKYTSTGGAAYQMPAATVPTNTTTGTLATPGQGSISGGKGLGYDLSSPLGGGTTQTTGTVPAGRSTTGNTTGITPPSTSQPAGASRNAGMAAAQGNVWHSAPQVQAAAPPPIGPGVAPAGPGVSAGGARNALLPPSPTMGGTTAPPTTSPVTPPNPTGQHNPGDTWTNGGVTYKMAPNGEVLTFNPAIGQFVNEPGNPGYNSATAGQYVNGQWVPGSSASGSGNGYTTPGGAGNSTTGTTQFPSNWNANNAPMPGVLNMQGANGASYETSPLYQWQLQQGEKNINRSLEARGRQNSSYGLNTLANFYNSLGANEAQNNYNRTFQMAQLGLQASSQQANQQAAYGGQASQLYQAAASGDAASAQQLATQMGVNSQQYGQLLAALTSKYAGDTASAQRELGSALASLSQWNAQGQAQNTWNWANPYSGNAIAGGANNASTWLGIGGQAGNFQQLLQALGLGGGSGLGAPAGSVGIGLGGPVR